MSIAVLYCEGNPGSPDARILSKILHGLCKVEPCGSKYGMGNLIQMKRKQFRGSYDTSGLFGIIDRDFPEVWKEADRQLLRWESSDGFHFGWRWNRCEIENFIVDPKIVKKALLKDDLWMEEYIKVLEDVRDQIAIYESCRITLSVSRIHVKPLSSSFGKARGNENHLFPVHLDEKSCQAQLFEKISAYHKQFQIDCTSAVHEERYEFLKEQCLPGGVRYCNFLSAFSGKDLLWAMDEWFKTKKIQGAGGFREGVLKGIQQSPDEVYKWLPEWTKLEALFRK